MSQINVNTIANAAGTVNKGVLQVVSTIKTTNFTTTSTSFVDITDMNVAITPRSTSSKVLVIFTCGCLANNTSGYQSFLILERAISGGATETIAKSTDSGTKESAFMLDNNFYSTGAASISILDDPSSITEVTYQLQARVGGGTMGFNRRGDNADNGAVSTITVMEIQG